MSRSKNYHDELLSDVCWVYVQKDEEGAYIIGITYKEDFFRKEVLEKRPVLLWRKFDDTFSAAGYRMVLNNLSEASLLNELNKYKKLTDEDRSIE